MTLLPRLPTIRLLSALLLAVVGLQALPSGSVGFERRHGSAFDISTVEVATSPYQRKADQGEIQRVATPVAPRQPAAEPANHATEAARDRPGFGLPPQTGPPLGRDIASLALAPRAPPHA